MFQNTHYAILTAMLAPAFFLTATASLLMSANNRLARVVDRLRNLLRELDEGDLDAAQTERMDRLIDVQPGAAWQPTLVCGHQLLRRHQPLGGH